MISARWAPITHAPIGALCQFRTGPCDQYTIPGILFGVLSMSHTIAEKTKLLNRIRRVRGQMEALERAITDEEGCAAVLHLIVAARGAINGLMAEVIEDHIRLHIVDAAKDVERRRGADELIEAIQSYLK